MRARPRYQGLARAAQAASAARGLVLAGLLAAAPAAVRAEIEIAGLEGELLDNALAYLGSNEIDCAQNEVYARRVVAVAESRILESLEAFGYYDAELATGLERDDECWQATIRVEPREPVRVRAVDIRVIGAASDDPVFQSVAAPQALRPGAILHHGRYETLKRRYLDLARDRGYAEAELIENRIDIYPEEHAADLSLVLASGPRYAVGDVELVQDELAESFVDDYVSIEPGQPFDNSVLRQVYVDLSNSGYFADVDVRALPADRETRTIPIRIVLTAEERLLIHYGIGFSTDTGPRLRAGRTVRRFNERGHRFSVEGQISPVVSEVTSMYRMPYGDPRYQWVSFNLGAKREDTETSSTRSIEAGARRVTDRAAGWSQTQFLSYAVEDFEVGSQSGRSRLLIPGVDWARLRGDDALRPANGSKLNFEIRGASEVIASDAGFLQTVVDAKLIRSLSERSRLLVRGTLGYTNTDEFQNLPPSVRFFAGGDSSIRGFEFESLGPVDENGDVIGGSRLAIASVELERAIKPRWSLAVFADSGNAFDASGFEARTGAGLGARWRSPLGPVRVDVAWPVHDPEHGARLHISLGPDL